MAQKVNIVGELDGKAISSDVKTRIQDALKKALTDEVIGIVPTHHLSVTHFSIVYDVA